MTGDDDDDDDDHYHPHDYYDRYSSLIAISWVHSDENDYNIIAFFGAAAAADDDDYYYHYHCPRVNIEKKTFGINRVSLGK